MKDYICGSVYDNTKYVSSHIVRGRRIALYNIGFAISSHGDKLLLYPMIPCLSPLIKLIHKHKKCSQFVFNAKTRKWKTAR